MNTVQDFDIVVSLSTKSVLCTVFFPDNIAMNDVKEMSLIFFVDNYSKCYLWNPFTENSDNK